MERKTIEILNTLININNDRIKGYVTASIETQKNLKKFVCTISTTSLKCKQELVNAVNSLGGDVAEINDDGNILLGMDECETIINL
jgi:hypothetical protein